MLMWGEAHLVSLPKPNRPETAMLILPYFNLSILRSCLQLRKMLRPIEKQIPADCVNDRLISVQ